MHYHAAGLEDRTGIARPGRDPVTTEQTQAAGSEDRDAILAELEQTRRSYHELLGSLTDVEWRRKSRNPAWSVGQLMWHLASGIKFSADGVERSKNGKGFNPPGFLVNPMNTMMTKFGARKATKDSVAQDYDAGHQKILVALDAVGDDDWKKGAKFFGQPMTVEDQLHSVKQHFDEHNADIQAVRRS